MDWSHSPQASRQHYMASLNLESREKRKGSRLKNMWLSDLEADVKETGYNWRQLERLAPARSALRSHVGGLWPRNGDESFDWLIDWFDDWTNSPGGENNYSLLRDSEVDILWTYVQSFWKYMCYDSYVFDAFVEPSIGPIILLLIALLSRLFPTGSR